MTAIELAGAFNFRDTGGLRAGDGVTRTGILFRSGNLSALQDPARARLRTLGLRRVIDLRDDHEVLTQPSLVDGVGLETVRVPLFAGSVASFFDSDASLADLYRSIVDESADRVVEVVRGVLADQPVLVHCTVGKDRTGVTVALTLAAAGVDEDAVVADYARSEHLLPAERNEKVLRYLRARHPDSVHLEELTTRSPARVMHDLLADLTVRYGAPVEFLRASGLADDEIRELRRVLVGPGDAVD